MQNNKIITLSPGGFRGFYTFGLCKFLKENYDLSEYVFSGASAGATSATSETAVATSETETSEVLATAVSKSALTEASASGGAGAGTGAADTVPVDETDGLTP